MRVQKTIGWLLALTPLLALFSCESDTMPDSQQGELVPVTVRLTTSAPEDMQTRANTADLVEDDYTISSLNVYISDGNSTTTLTESDFTFSGSDENYQGTSNSTVELVRGRTYTVYALANTTSDINYQTNSPVDAISMVNSTATPNTVPMSAQTTWTIDRETESITLVRMVAQMKVTLIDQRTATDKPDINSVKIEGFPSTTYLYRQSSVSIPEGTELDGSWEQTNNSNDWTWSTDDNPRFSFSGFYLHETNNGGRITVQEAGEGKEPRIGSFSSTIPRNRILPLYIYITDYSLDIFGTYELAPVAVNPFTVDITPNGYTVNLPEGCSNVEMKIQLKHEGTIVTPSVDWTVQESGDLDELEVEVNTTDGLSITSDALTALPTGTKTLHLTTTYDDKNLEFDVTIHVRELGNEEWTRSASPEAQPIIIEL